MDIPHADLEVDEALAARLIATQFPHLAGPIELAAQGWDNALFRLGDDLAVRMPRREVAAHLIEHEQRWLPVLQPLVELPLPTPVALGRPDEEYPFAWSVIPWVDGASGALLAPIDRDSYAVQLADFFAALHVPAASEAPRNPVRGVPLGARAEVVRARLDGLVERLPREEVDALRAVWDAGVEAPPYGGLPLWLHGDPHPGNVIVAGEPAHLATVVDFGDVCAGDPATDLSAAWLHFGPVGRAAFRARYEAARGADAASWVRARAWAVSIGSAVVAASDGSGVMAAMGRAVIEQTIAG